jgi:hypothetical protein
MPVPEAFKGRGDTYREKGNNDYVSRDFDQALRVSGGRPLGSRGPRMLEESLREWTITNPNDDAAAEHRRSPWFSN